MKNVFANIRVLFGHETKQSEYVANVLKVAPDGGGGSGKKKTI